MEVAAVQMLSEFCDKAQNMRTAETHLREAASRGGQIACLPEMWSTGHFGSIQPVNDVYFELAETVTGTTVEFCRDMAVSLGVAVIAPLFESAGPGEYYNSAVCIDSLGKLCGVYRKTHVAFSRNGCEKYYMRPGDSLPVFELCGWRVGVLICYDRDFPETCRVLALQGAEVVFVPTCTSASMRSVWRSILQTRAYENQIYTVGVGAVGNAPGAEYPYCGDSRAYDPRGTLVASTEEEADDIVLFTADRAEVAKARVERFLYRDRRPQLYSSLSD